MDDYTITGRGNKLMIESADGSVDKVKGIEFLRFLGDDATYSVDRDGVSLTSDANVDALFGGGMVSQLIASAENAMADSDLVEAETMELVQAASAGPVDIGGAPYTIVTRHTNTVGLIIPDVTNAFFANFAKNIQVTCQEAGYNMFLCNTNNLPEKDIEYVNALLERQVDGILLSLAATSDQSSAAECCDLMKKMGKPLVLIDRMVDDAEVLSVLVDHEMGGFLATQHLIQLGHTRIGCITGPMTVQSSKQRLKGYQRALKESKIEFDLSLIQEFRFEMLSDFNIVKKLLNEKASAIFAFNDLINDKNKFSI